MEDIYLIIFSIISVIIASISLYISIRIKKQYEVNMKKLGNGENFAEMIKDYVSQVENLNKRDDQIIQVCNNLNNELAHCIKKVGLYRYDAFGNTKNKLSFSLALLDRENNGIVINSIYGQDNSNVYAKPIIKGSSKYNLSEEEKEAINIAIIPSKKDLKKENL